MTDPQNPQPGPQQPPAYTPPPAPGYAQPPAYDPAAYGQQPPAYDPAAYPAAPPAYEQQVPVYGQQPYAAAPPAPYGAPAQPTVPGRTMGIVAFILSFFASLVGLILGIVALVQSRKAGVKNGFALAAIIIGSVLLVLSIIATIIVFVILGNIANEVIVNCGPGGSGVVQIWGQLVPCDQIDSDMRIRR